jgi:hypothetical protein
MQANAVGRDTEVLTHSLAFRADMRVPLLDLLNHKGVGTLEAIRRFRRSGVENNGSRRLMGSHIQ